MDNQQGPMVECREPCWVLCGSLDGKGVGEKEHVYVYGWVPLLTTWIYHSIANLPYSHLKFTNLQKINTEKDKI